MDIELKFSVFWSIMIFIQHFDTLQANLERVMLEHLCISGHLTRNDPIQNKRAF